MASGDAYGGEGERVVVGVSKDASCKEAIKWAILNKLKSPDDVLVLLHVVTKIPSPGVELYQSEVNNTMFVHYVRTVVQPMMLALKKLVDPQIKLELKVGRNNSREKGIVEESKKLRATTLVLGTNARGMFSIRGKSSGTGAYCVKYRPPGTSVYVVQKDKVVLFKEAEASPITSNSVSPSASGLMSASGSGANSGNLEPSYSHQYRDSGQDYYDEARAYGQYQQQYPGAGQGGGSGPQSGRYDPAGGTPPMPHLPPPVRGGPPSYGMQSRDSGSGSLSGPGGPNDIQQAAALSALAWSQGTAATGGGGEGGGGGGAPWMEGSGPQQAAAVQQGYMAEIDAWKTANAAASYHQQQEYMAELQERMAKARAALAGMSLGGADPAAPTESAAAPVPTPPPVFAAPIPAPIPSSMPIAGSGDYDSELRRELEMMRMRAAEAEKARVEAELRAQRALTEADKSLRAVEAQNKRREMETAVRIELAAQEAAKAMAEAEEARRAAEVEAKKTEEALRQAAKTQAALELEAQKREEAEKKAKPEGAVTQTPAKKALAALYREYSFEDIKAATENFLPERKLGEGGFGLVYSGNLHHTPVAIKVLKNADAMQAASEFQQEVEVLCQIQHPHVVMLLGCCPERYCLVYEFMANGSLEDRLMCANGTPPLPWYVRFRVAAEIASALLILHTRPVPIVHRDLKPGNILLDKNLVAKLGDVGLARLMPELSMEQTCMRESVPVGTFAYVDPEFQRTGEFGPKSDVYALGIVLLDLLTGRTPNVYEGLEEAVDNGDEARLAEFLDKRAGKWPVGLAMEVAQIAIKCSEMRRKKRPDLETEVMPVLDKARAVSVKAEEEAKKVPVKRSLRDAPSSLFCPITQEMMVNPVLASDGHTYELVAIQQWLEKSDRSPMTNMKLPNKDLMPNHAVRSMIQEWKERHQ